MLAGKVEEAAREIVVRMGVPGMDNEDCHIRIKGSTLYLNGEKRYKRETHDSIYHVMERACGCCQRVIPLPGNVGINKAEAAYKNGVLIMRLSQRQAAGNQKLSRCHET